MLNVDSQRIYKNFDEIIIDENILYVQEEKIENKN